VTRCEVPLSARSRHPVAGKICYRLIGHRGHHRSADAILAGNARRRIKAERSRRPVFVAARQVTVLPDGRRVWFVKSSCHGPMGAV